MMLAAFWGVLFVLMAIPVEDPDKLKHRRALEESGRPEHLGEG
jgi:hypothetical protein